MTFTLAQLHKLADIWSDIAQVALASVAIPFFFVTPDLLLAALGLATAVIAWLFSLLLVRDA